MVFGRGIESSIRLSINMVVVTVAISMALVNFKIAADIRESESIKLEQSTQLNIVNEIKSSFRSYLDDFSSLADSSILVTSLTDSQGRNIYLSQYLSQKTQTSHITYQLLDYKGRSLLRTGDVGQVSLDSAKKECNENVGRSVSTALSDDYLIFCGNINFPSDNMPIGYLIGVTPINDFLDRNIHINSDIFHNEIHLKLLPMGEIENGLIPIYWEDATILAANINLSMPIDPNKITSLNNIVLISIGFLINIIIGYILSRFLAWRISRPIINLSEAALAFAKGNINVVDKKGMAHEIKILANTLEATFIERDRIQGELQHLVNFDHLTGALTRSHFHNSFDSLLQLAKRSGDGIALLYLDLDRFKLINDTYGHDAGDQVLQSVVERLRVRLRGSDLVGRRGGDEFNVGLHPVRNRLEVETVCNELIILLSQPITINHDIVVTVGVSIGIALFPDHGDMTGLLEINADTALYRAKGRGGNHFEWFAVAAS
jgi:diguanylate cyclase (GGDEF)-like protein